jgi:hypothetical protein
MRRENQQQTNEENLRWDDATWILTNAFMMLTIKTG